MEVNNFNYPKQAKHFKEVFNLNLMEYLDRDFLKLSIPIPLFDIIKFEGYIESTHGEIPYGTSLNEVIQRYYGDRGVKTINELINI